MSASCSIPGCGLRALGTRATRRFCAEHYAKHSTGIRLAYALPERRCRQGAAALQRDEDARIRPARCVHCWGAEPLDPSLYSSPLRCFWCGRFVPLAAAPTTEAA